METSTIAKPSIEGIVEISEKRDGKIVVLRPVGRIDNDTTLAFRAKLLEALGSGEVPVLVDFSGVEYISSAGLRALMMASQKSKAGDGRLTVAALTPMVKEIFEHQSLLSDRAGARQRAASDRGAELIALSMKRGD